MSQQYLSTTFIYKTKRADVKNDIKKRYLFNKALLGGGTLK